MNMQETTELLRIWQSWLGSCRDACDVDGQILWDRIDTALAAAPTPPAQEQGERNWFEGTEDCDGSPLPTDDEIVAFIGEEFGSDRVAIETFRQIQDYLIKRRLQIPPAQEDEPVAWTGQDGNIEPISNRLRRSRPDLYKHYTIPLSYTRPQSDELRKAAEEFFAAYDSENADPNEVAKYLENLRAALERK